MKQHRVGFDGLIHKTAIPNYIGVKTLIYKSS